MKFLTIVTIVAFLSGSAAFVHADDSITLDSFTDQTSGTMVNLNSGTSAWAYYGNNNKPNGNQTGSGSGAQKDNGQPTTDASNLGGFTALVDKTPTNPSTLQPTFFTSNPGGIDSVSFTGGVGGNNVSTISNSPEWEQIQDSFNGASFSLSTTLFATTETFDFYLQNYDTTSDLTASLNDSSDTTWSVTNKVLSNTGASGTDGTGSGNTATKLTLTVTGDVGDVLTFTDTADDTNVKNTQYGGIVGIVAVDVQAVPEPGTFALVLCGAMLFIFVRHFRRGEV